MATFVLVHGAWHGGWCWRKVTPLLRAAGHDVHTPTLTGLGERVHLLSREVGLATHVQDVVNVLEYEDLSDVILVGHSYGGMVITGAAGQAARRVAHLVYLDAFVPSDGQSQMDILGENPRRQFEALAQAEGDGWLLPRLGSASWETFLRENWGFSDEADVRWVAERLRPHPLKTFTDPLRCPNLAEAALARTYILCTPARPGGAFARAGEAARTADSGWRYREIATGHDAMVTAPRELADLLLETVRA